MNSNNLTIVLCLFVSICGTSCSKDTDSTSPSRTESSTPTSSQSSTKNLTTEKAQNTIDRFMSANAKGTMKIKGGIREIPSENSAVADLMLTDFTSNDGKFYPQTTPHGRSLSWTTGTAVFSHYTDGRWVLSQVVVIQDFTGYRGTYKPDIEVR